MPNYHSIPFHSFPFSNFNNSKHTSNLPNAAVMKENVEITQETTPDLLKNTPYNIARLEDVIEHCKGRHKYLARTSSPSDGGDVRWYFCKVPLAPNELAASVPRTEIVGKSDYFRFGMRDSLAIEASFLQKEDELLSSWWREYAECSEGPNCRATTSKAADIKKIGFQDASQPCLVDETEEERVGVPVKGGLYEVDLLKRHCFPVYWSGENRRVLRGHWFARKGGLDWLPLREDVSEQLEIAYHNQVWHRRTFQPSGLFAARVDLQGSTPGLHALFTGEDNTWEAWLNVDASGFSSFINVYGTGIKLRRGYSASHSTKPTQDELRQQKEEEMDDYCSQVPVRHLVFMVHGIGQRLEKSNLVDDVGNFRHITASLAEQHLTSHQRGAQRVLFIPCQWRKGLKLSGETAVEKITLDGVRGLRVMLSATVHDVLYYMSPIYCQDIINSVSNQLNKLYLKFRKRNPGYDGKVSIYGHSLGSVLSYDILCHQDNLSSPFPMDWMYKDHASTGESLPDMNNQLSSIDTSIHQDANAKVDDQVKEKMDPITEENLMTQSTVAYQDENAKDVSAMNSFMPDFDEMSTVANSDEREGTHDVIDDTSDYILSNNLSHSAEETETKSDLLHSCSEGNNEKNMDTDDKDQTIKLLLKEIDSLRAKITKLESESNGEAGENKKALVTIPKQPTAQKLAPILDDAPKSYTPYINYTKLEFKVDTFFAVGSPLGVFLALRNIRIGIGKGHEYWEEDNISEEIPACRRMFNIFHPFDPVAYRLEPLVCKEYLMKRPVIIPYHRGGKRLHIGFQEFTEDLAARTHAIMGHLHTVKVKVLTACQSRNADRLEDGSENDQEKEERTYGSIMMERLTGSVEGRIDHMLQDKTFEHPYLQAIGSHTNYWRDYDTALFILRHLYRDIPEDPDMFVENSGGESKNSDSSGGWSDRRQAADQEELPLTFSDRMAVRNFSRKARSFGRKS